MLEAVTVEPLITAAVSRELLSTTESFDIIERVPLLSVMVPEGGSGLMGTPGSVWFTLGGLGAVSSDVLTRSLPPVISWSMISASSSTRSNKEPRVLETFCSVALMTMPSMTVESMTSACTTVELTIVELMMVELMTVTFVRLQLTETWAMNIVDPSLQVLLDTSDRRALESISMELVKLDDVALARCRNVARTSAASTVEWSAALSSSWE